MSEQQREQVRRFIADQVGITSLFILAYDSGGGSTKPPRAVRTWTT